MNFTQTVSAKDGELIVHFDVSITPIPRELPIRLGFLRLCFSPRCRIGKGRGRESSGRQEARKGMA